jgi:thiamine-phosphate pyrophosphorylase
MFEIIAVTNRHLCPGGEINFLNQIEKIAAAGVNTVILREKDMLPQEYEALARKVAAICGRCNVRFIPHGFTAAARNLGYKQVHLTWDAWRSLAGNTAYEVRTARHIGVSIHSPAEACYAAELGAAYLIAGHVFETGCKKGLEGRGLKFLNDVCKAVSIPVYGIGGISENNIAEVAKAGAAGACLMSTFMQSPDPAAVLAGLRSQQLFRSN